MTVNVLGQSYKIIFKNYTDDEAFSQEKIAGYCDNYTHAIVICKMQSYPGWEHEPEKTCEEAQKEGLRHEIVHAFLCESGLNSSSNSCDRPWARNEEMVDWIALQGTKIYKAWQEAGAI